MIEIRWEVIGTSNASRVAIGICTAVVAWLLLLQIPGVLNRLRHSDEIWTGLAGLLVFVLVGAALMLATIGLLASRPARAAAHPMSGLAVTANVSALLAVPAAFVLFQLWLVIRVIIALSGH